MVRRLIAALACAPLVALAVLASVCATARAASTSESQNPINDQGSSYDYRSNITTVLPSVPGVSFQVLEFADRILLTNHSGRTVTIYGYQGEPYARVLANGTAEQNVRSPATYLNTNFYGDVNVPPLANPSARPKWVVVARSGQFEWHDHRIHWMSPVPPPQVKDKGKRTLIFDWQVPIEVGARKGAIDGQLFWTPENSKASLGVILLGVAIAAAGLLFVLFVRRRRSRGAVDGERGPRPSGGSSSEAW